MRIDCFQVVLNWNRAISWNLSTPPACQSSRICLTLHARSDVERGFWINFNFFQVAVLGTMNIDPVHCQFGIPENDAEHNVEIMDHSPCQMSYFFHFLGL